MFLSLEHDERTIFRLCNERRTGRVLVMVHLHALLISRH